MVAQATLINTASFAQLERTHVGATHEELGGALCDQWHFPVALVNACQYHHDFRALPVNAQAMPALVHLADRMSARLGAGFCRSVDGEGLETEACLLLGLSHADIEAVEAELPILLPQTESLLAA